MSEFLTAYLDLAGPAAGGYMPVVAAVAAGATAGYVMRPARVG